MNDKAKAVAAFLNWADQRAPGIKQEIIRAANVGPSNMGALGQDNTATDTAGAPWYTKIIDAAEKIIPTVYQYKTQKKVWDLQMQRAKQGQEPLDVSQYTAPPIRVQVEPTATSFEIAPETKRMLWIGGAVVGGLILFSMLNRNN